MKILFLTLIIIFMTGCSSISMVSGAKGTDSYEKISFRGPPKDFQALDFKFGEDTRLKAGDAATAEQPWANVADSGVDILGAVLFCRANPTQCAAFKKE